MIRLWVRGGLSVACTTYTLFLMHCTVLGSCCSGMCPITGTGMYPLGMYVNFGLPVNV